MKGRLVRCSIALLLSLASAAAGLGLPKSQVQPRQEVEFLPRVRDRCLIENVNDVWNYRRFGEVTVNVCGETVTLRDIPEEYVRYSAFMTRLP